MTKLTLTGIRAIAGSKKVFFFVILARMAPREMESMMTLIIVAIIGKKKSFEK